MSGSAYVEGIPASWYDLLFGYVIIQEADIMGDQEALILVARRKVTYSLDQVAMDLVMCCCLGLKSYSSSVGSPLNHVVKMLSVYPLSHKRLPVLGQELRGSSIQAFQCLIIL